MFLHFCFFQPPSDSACESQPWKHDPVFKPCTGSVLQKWTLSIQNTFHILLSVKNKRATGITFLQGKEKWHSMRLTYEYKILIRIQVVKIQIFSGRLEKMTQHISVFICTHFCPLWIGCADLKLCVPVYLQLYRQYFTSSHIAFSVIPAGIYETENGGFFVTTLASCSEERLLESRLQIDCCWVCHGFPQSFNPSKRHLRTWVSWSLYIYFRFTTQNAARYSPCKALYLASWEA
jgi:hypothetical protein